MAVDWKPVVSVPTDGRIFWLFWDDKIHLASVKKEENEGSTDLVLWIGFISTKMGFVPQDDLGFLEDCESYCNGWTEFENINIPAGYIYPE
jgi:hypothetical protein